MGSFSWWHWAIVLVVVLVMFGGKGKVSDLMGDVAKGIKNFKSGMAEDEKEVAEEAAKTVEHQAAETVAPAAKAKAKKS